MSKKPIESGESWEVFSGPTPAGGVKSVWHYYRIDENGLRRPARPDEATMCEIHEIDATGGIIMTTHGHLAPGG
ncbi:MAG: hypothetical protein P3W97_000495 [Tepidimonas sp.]|uniref:hypothetical protein n=1 Tax=Tepidimonas sp. TaxID=2002775 RepID=UPI00259F4B6B|nr:hypothetical protein [Tepidimonas sp.]MDM7455771.1 hypothetical protein [Tepidimonas sp.]